MALNRLDGVFTAANPALQRFLGRNEQEIVGHNASSSTSRRADGNRGRLLAGYRSGLADRTSYGKEIPEKGRQPGVAEHNHHSGAVNRDAAPFCSRCTWKSSDARAARGGVARERGALASVFENTAPAL